MPGAQQDHYNRRRLRFRLLEGKGSLDNIVVQENSRWLDASSG